jgi:aryl-alcohol dehydrogenase-like predicted oxidoreductase
VALIQVASLRQLGRSSIAISPIGLGCWQFSEGSGLVGGYWPALPQETTHQIVAAVLAAGINWFDTAEAYGGGRSEAALSRALVAAGKSNGEVVIATKWQPFARIASSITRTISERRRHLAPFDIDLYQVHGPYAFASVTGLMNAMADLVERGEISAVGVSNFSARQMRAAHRALAARGITLVSNQVRYNLVNRRIERNGVLAAAKELGVTIIAYSPLAQGVLSGKFHRDPGLIQSRPGPRKRLPSFRRRGLERTRSLVVALEEIGRAHGASASQVALNWVLNAQGVIVVAIPGATTVEQARDNAAAMSLRLDGTDMRRLDELSLQFR